MNPVMECAVVRVNRYNFEDEKTGNVFQGVNIQFLGDVEENKDVKGIEVGKISGDLQIYDMFDKVPGIYSIELKAKINGKGNITYKAAKVEYKGELKKVK